MLTPKPPQDRIDLISAYGSMLMDGCRANRMNPDPIFIVQLQALAEYINDEVTALAKELDDARFRATWGDGGTVATALERICATGIDEGFDDLSEEAGR